MADKSIRVELVKHELRKLANRDVIANYEIKKPSDLPCLRRPSKLPKVRLDLKRKGNDYLFEVMLKMQHKNILRLEAIQEKRVGGEDLLAVFVEPHDGPLIAYLKDLVADNTTGIIPSQAFRDIVRQIIVAIEELRLNRLYHGAISLENILHVKGSYGIIIKLANFRKLPDSTDADLEIAQLLDWVGVGQFLAYISNAARSLNRNYSCTLIDRLALKLQGLTDTTLLPNLMSETLSDPFFWDTRKRTNFYIHDIAEALKDNTFVQRVRNYNWQLPWNNNPHEGIIAAMNEFREQPYEGTDPVDNVKCMSGAYTHQDDLVGKVQDTRGVLFSVDAAVQKNQPDLCLTLYRLLKGEIAGEEAAGEEAAGEEVAGEEAAGEDAAAAVDAEMHQD